MIVIYYRIYVVSSRIAASEAKSKPGLSDSHPPSEAPSTHTIRKPSSEENHNINCPNHNGHAGRNKTRKISSFSTRERQQIVE